LGRLLKLSWPHNALEGPAAWQPRSLLLLKWPTSVSPWPVAAALLLSCWASAVAAAAAAAAAAVTEYTPPCVLLLLLLLRLLQ